MLTFHTDGSAQSRGFELSFSFLPISPGEFSTHLSFAFSVMVYSCYFTQSVVTGFVLIALIQEGVFTVYLTKGFAVVVRLVSNKSQMTPKFVKKKKACHRCSYLILTFSGIYH